MFSSAEEERGRYLRCTPAACSVDGIFDSCATFGTSVHNCQQLGGDGVVVVFVGS